MLGGLGVRLELTFDKLEDLQVALGALLECCAEDDDVTLRVSIDREGALTLAVGSFDKKVLARELDRETSEGLDLRRVLQTVADSVEVSEEDDGAWVVLTKQLERTDG